VKIIKKYLTPKCVLLCAVLLVVITAAAVISDKDYEYDLTRFVPLSVAIYSPDTNIPVTIVADDKVHLVETGGTVENALNSAGIYVDNDDIVNVPLNAPITEETEIVINRVFKERLTYTERLAYQTKYIVDEKLPIGESIVLAEGEYGSKVRAYTHTYVDGELAETEYIATVFSENPEPRVVKIGGLDRNLPDEMISEIPFPEDFALDENGVPTEYEKVLTGKGVAYSAYQGAKGASGGYCIPGTVAVNPNIIPYGTKMYIVSTDGKYVYGYAVANDTGTALMDGLCLVDLYMDSYDQTCRWGAHEVYVYILN
jgi:3D (Asp-Asp-Asp) domain-containing protein